MPKEKGIYLALKKMDKKGSVYKLYAVNEHGEALRRGNLMTVNLEKGIVEVYHDIDERINPQTYFEVFQL